MNAELKVIDINGHPSSENDLPEQHSSKAVRQLTTVPGLNSESSRLADALLSRTQQQVLGLLFGSPEYAFNASEIIQRAGCGSGSVQRELARLHDCGLVTLTQTGLQKRYQVNSRSPVFASLQDLFATLHSPWLGLHQALATLPGDLAFAAILTPEDATAPWTLVLAADGLALQQVYSALQPIERQMQRRFAVTLHATADWQALTPAQRIRLCPATATVIIARPVQPTTQPIHALP